MSESPVLLRSSSSFIQTTLASIAALAVLNGCIVQGPPYAPAPSTYEAVNEPAPNYSEPDVEITASEAPPALPEYDQPPCPEPGYLWTPGYWGYGGEGYYWVPGTWVMPPRVGLLWTPGYWGWNERVFLFHRGYWGPHVGFYGGVNYGGGYVGNGYAGGRWVRNEFAYNTAVNNVNRTYIHNTYNQTVINNVTINRVSYNGGRGGVDARPSRQDEFARRETHVPPPYMQTRHVNEAGQNPALLERYNHGRPAIAATPRAASFDAPNVVGAHGAAPGPAGRERESAPRDDSRFQSQPHTQMQQPAQPRDTQPRAENWQRQQPQPSPAQPYQQQEQHQAPLQPRYQPQQRPQLPVQQQNQAQTPARPQGSTQGRPDVPQRRQVQPAAAQPAQPQPQARPQSQARPAQQPTSTSPPQRAGESNRKRDHDRENR
jgi:WXXGXW repeat (2 copies)